MVSTQDSRSKASKRFRPSSGSDTSIDGDLDYLDLDTGSVIQAASTPHNQDEAVTMSKKSYDALMKKLTTMEKCLRKLDKLDKLDQVEVAVRNMDKRVSKVETRLDKAESVVDGVEKSVSFLSEKYDDYKVERDAEKVENENS